MDTYTILKEISGQGFVPTGDTFTGTPDDAEAYRQQLQDTNGGCYAMQKSGS